MLSSATPLSSCGKLLATIFSCRRHILLLGTFGLFRNGQPDRSAFHQRVQILVQRILCRGNFQVFNYFFIDFVGMSTHFLRISRNRSQVSSHSERKSSSLLAFFTFFLCSCLLFSCRKTLEPAHSLFIYPCRRAMKSATASTVQACCSSAEMAAGVSPFWGP